MKKESLKILILIAVPLLIFSLIGIITVGVIYQTRENVFYDPNNDFSIDQSGTREYECSGTCYCNQDYIGSELDMERRYASQGIPIGRGLSIFVFAVSTLAALEMAKDKFDQECHMNFANSCGKDSIVSEMGDCVENKELTEKEKRCPLCGKPNNCMHGTGLKCWCVDVNVPTEIFEKIPDESLHKDCVCKDCVEEYVQKLKKEEEEKRESEVECNCQECSLIDNM